VQSHAGFISSAGHKVMLDGDLADRYQVETSSLNRQVKRNIDRFPADFMFQVSDEAGGRGGRRYLPYASPKKALRCCRIKKRAVLVNVAIMRAFVRLCEILISDKGLANRLDSLEKKYDSSFRSSLRLSETNGTSIQPKPPTYRL
jgi:hypothetical protein